MDLLELICTYHRKKKKGIGIFFLNQLYAKTFNNKCLNASLCLVELAIDRYWDLFRFHVRFQLFFDCNRFWLLHVHCTLQYNSFKISFLPRTSWAVAWLSSSSFTARHWYIPPSELMTLLQIWLIRELQDNLQNKLQNKYRKLRVKDLIISNSL